MRRGRTFTQSTHFRKNRVKSYLICSLLASALLFLFAPAQAQYCTPGTGVGCSANDQYQSFSTSGGTTNINHNPGGSCVGGPNGYASFSGAGLSASAAAGTTMSFSILNNGSWSEGYEIWIDWNNDAIFQTSEEVYASGTDIAAGATATGSFTVPAGATVATTDLRILCRFAAGGTAGWDACDNGSSTFGISFDFPFTVTTPPCPAGSPLPAIVAMTGGGGYCSGGAGVNVGLTGSAIGINYQLYLGGSPVGSPVAGIGAALNFGLQTTAGVYTATATNASTGCTSTMSGSETVTIYPLPNVHNMTGGGDYCSGGTGVAVGLDGSDAGTNYQLYRGGSPVVGTIIAGTGGPLTWGLQTTAGTYTSIATMGGFTGCRQDMNGTATVIVDPLPTVYSVTGTGSYCSGGTGVAVGLSSSDVGINYQLYMGTTPIGAPVAGTGSAISFGLQTTAGTYTVKATDATTGCLSNMSGSATVTVNALPTAYTVTGGGGYCSGGAGANVGLSFSNAGISYQLYLGGVPTGTPVIGTGAALSFGPQSVAGTYTVVATNVATGCTNDMTGSVTVSVNPLPNVYTMTGGGQFCAGGGGVAVGLSGSDAGVNYQLYRGTITTVGGPVGGTGSAVSFGLQAIAGTYTSIATNTTTGCTASMSSSASVTVDPLPAAIPMSGGGGYCTGGSGVNIGLASSATGFSYQLWMGATPIGGAVTGTGSALSFGLQTTAGTYTATGTNTVTGCTNTMSGSETVTIYSLPTVYSVTGGGSYCSGGTGVAVGLSGSSLLTTYQLYLGGSPVLGASMTGTGSAISFGARTGAGTYTVVATSTSPGCTNPMSGSASIVVNPLPTAYTVTGGGSYCVGGTGSDIGLSNSTVGVNYQLYFGYVAVGSPLAGTGSSLDFGMQTATGNYSVVATDATTGCVNNMANTVTVSTTPLPAAFTVTGGGAYCTGGTGVPVGLTGSQATVTYQLYNGVSTVGTPLTGGGTSLNFGLQTATGTYTVVATSTLSGCTNNMSGSATVSITPLPTAYTVTGGGGYCSGSTGLHIGLSSSDLGVRYQLWRGSAGVGSSVAGTGSALDFGVFTTAGTYSVSATSVGTLCNSNMSGTATIVVNPLPTVYAVTGGGAYCSGGAGVSIGLINSQTGVNYQLMLGSTAVGSPVTGSTGSSISFGMQTVAGTYTVVATDGTTGCVSNMSGSARVSITAPPTAYTVTGGGSFCTGGTGVAVGLSGSQSGVNYQLYNGASPVGTPHAGTGATISFGAMTTAGVYTVGATTTGGCTNTMAGSATVTVSSLPTVYTVTGGGTYCSGGSGMAIGLSGSDAGVSYKLYRGTTLVTTVAGTGSTISFGSQTIAGTYTVVATATGGCTSSMSGSATITVSSVPAIIAMTGGGSYCSGGSGVLVGLAASAGGVSYQLWRGGTTVGSAISGTGMSLSFGLQTTAGTYTATATNGAGCTSTMSGSATVYVNSTPAVYSVTGGGSYCSGGSGVHVGLSGSTSGISYKLYRSGTPVATMTGTGAALDFGPQTSAGTYTVIAMAATGCTATMSGSATIAVNTNPTISGSMFTLAPGWTTTLSGSISGGTWTSSMTSVATVGGSTGLVTGIGLGTTVITYTLSTGCYGTHALNVTATGHRDANPTATATTTDITVAPNPNHGTFTIKGTVATNDEHEVTIQVTNMLGQVVYSNKVNVENGELNETIQLSSNLANGMYLLSLRSGTETKVVHVVVQQ